MNPADDGQPINEVVLGHIGTACAPCNQKWRPIFNTFKGID
jgi:hypothetical protein